MTAFLLASAQSLLLAWCDQRFQLLALPFADLMDLLPLLRGRERGVRAHRLNLLTRLLRNLMSLFDRRLGNARNLPARFLLRMSSILSPRELPPNRCLRSGA